MPAEGRKRCSRSERVAITRTTPFPFFFILAQPLRENFWPFVAQVITATPIYPVSHSYPLPVQMDGLNAPLLLLGGHMPVGRYPVVLAGAVQLVFAMRGNSDI